MFKLNLLFVIINKIKFLFLLSIIPLLITPSAISLSSATSLSSSATSLSSSATPLSIDLYFINESNYRIIIPHIININKLLTIYNYCADDCLISFLFKCLKYDLNDNRKLINIFDLAVFKRKLISNQAELINFNLPELDPNLERCIKNDDLNQKFNQLAVEIHIQFLNNLNVINFNTFKHKFDLILSSYSYINIWISQSIYRFNQTIKFIILPFNLNLKEFNQIVLIKLLSPNNLLIKKWHLNYFSNEQLNQFKFKLNSSHLIGLYTIEAIVLNQSFRKSFFIINNKINHIKLIVNFKDYHLIEDELLSGTIIVRNLPFNNQLYYIRCSVFLVIKDVIDKQEVQIDLTKFAIKKLSIENLIELELNYLFDSIDRIRLNEFLNPKYDLRKQSYLKIQTDLYLKNDENDDCNYLAHRLEQRSFKLIKLIQKSKYIFCPKEKQSNHNRPQFTIQLQCWIINLINQYNHNDLNNQLNNDNQIELKEIENNQNQTELIILRSYVITNLNYRIHFKTIKLNIKSNLINIDLNLIDKFDTNDLIQFKSLNIELRLTNNYRENLKFNFNNLKNQQFQLKLNKLNAEIDTFVTLHFEYSFNRLDNIYLVLLSDGQLLDVQIIDYKSKQIKITDNMYPKLDLFAYTKFDNKLFFAKSSIKINKSQLNQSINQFYTSFKLIDNKTKLMIKLLSTINSFIHLRSIKSDQFEQNLNTILINYLNDNNCFLIDDLFDVCINQLKFNELDYQSNTTNNENNQINQTLINAIDNLFLNQSKSKPLFFEIYFFNQNLTKFIEFVQLRNLIETDFEENLIYLNTELTATKLDQNNGESSKSNFNSTYERIYEFRLEEESIYYLNLIELDTKHYQLRKLILKNKFNHYKMFNDKLIKNLSNFKFKINYNSIIFLYFIEFIIFTRLIVL